MGNAKYVLPVLESLKQFTCTHDYLHETRFHRQDCIYRMYYGGFLQPLQVYLGWERINRDPVRKGMQTHELFIQIDYRSARQHRFNRFIESIEMPVLDECDDDETARQKLLKMVEAYAIFCTKFENGKDEPSRIALFIKSMEAYNGCVHGVSVEDFWILEKEGLDWPGAHKLNGKANYVTETLHRNNTLRHCIRPSLPGS